MSKSKLKLSNVVFELTTSGVFVLGLLYLGGYYLINKSLPDCVMNVSISIPIILFALSAIGGNAKAWFNQFMRFAR